METVLKILGCIVLITLWVLWNWFTHWFETEWNKPSNTDIEEEEKKWLNKYSDQLAVHSVYSLSKWMNEWMLNLRVLLNLWILALEIIQKWNTCSVDNVHS